MSEAGADIFWLGFAGMGCMVFGLLAMLASATQRQQRLARLERASGLGSHRASGGRGDASLLARLGADLRQVMARLGERLAVGLGGEAKATAAELASAGYRSRDALLIYAFAKTILPTAALLLGLVWLGLRYPLDLRLLMPLAVVIGCALSLSKSVDFYVGQRRKNRLAQIRRSFPDLLELLVITSEAGLGPQPGLRRVAGEMACSDPALSREILQLVSEMAMTQDRRAAYDKLKTRVPLPEIAVFVQTLDQSDRYGTPFSRAMRTLIEEQRANRLMAVEEKAARLPVIMTIPLIFCIMPAVFVVLVGPAALSVFDNIISGG